MRVEPVGADVLATVLPEGNGSGAQAGAAGAATRAGSAGTHGAGIYSAAMAAALVRVSVKVALTVPVFPSVTDASLNETPGGTAPANAAVMGAGSADSRLLWARHGGQLERKPMDRDRRVRHEILVIVHRQAGVQQNDLMAPRQPLQRGVHARAVGTLKVREHHHCDLGFVGSEHRVVFGDRHAVADVNATQDGNARIVAVLDQIFAVQIEFLRQCEDPYLQMPLPSP